MNFTKAARPVIMGQNGMVPAGHQLGSLAGVKFSRKAATPWMPRSRRRSSWR